MKPFSSPSSSDIWEPHRYVAVRISPESFSGSSSNFPDPFVKLHFIQLWLAYSHLVAFLPNFHIGPKLLQNSVIVNTLSSVFYPINVGSVIVPTLITSIIFFPSIQLENRVVQTCLFCRHYHGFCFEKPTSMISSLEVQDQMEAVLHTSCQGQSSNIPFQQILSSQNIQEMAWVNHGWFLSLPTLNPRSSVFINCRKIKHDFAFVERSHINVYRDVNYVF